MIDLTIDGSKIEKSFDRIARDLLEDYKLQVGNAYYQFTEMEFYYNHYDEKDSKDNFAHKHGEEIKNGTWRLHGAGLDIVLKKTGVYYGGILIRGIEEIDGGEQPIAGTYIDGPWKTVTKCIQQSVSVNETSSFSLVPRLKPRTRLYKKSPRVGLFLKKATDLEYICKPWRYTTMPIMTKNYRHLIILQLTVNKDKDLIENPNLVMKGEKTRNVYLKDFEDGKKMNAEEFVRKSNTVKHTCQLFGCYINKNYPSL